MNVDGYTYLIYDKFAGDHGYRNVHTKDIKIKELFDSDYTVFEGKAAINEFNKFGGIHKIDEAIDLNFYNIYMFIIDKDPKIHNSVEKRITVVSINNKLLEQKIDNIPNRDFLISACSFHCSYNPKDNSDLNINEKVKAKAAEATADPTDKIIENPQFTKIKLFDYQRRTVKWMYDTEVEKKTLRYSFNDEIFFGNIVYDSIKKNFCSVETRKSLSFRGGLLADEVGLGKTFQMISLSLLNPLPNPVYFDPSTKLLNSKATIIICPNHLCNQWIREVDKTIDSSYNATVVSLLTKPQYDKCTYLDILDADFVVVSYNFLANECYLDEWLKNLANGKKTLTYLNSSLFSKVDAKNVSTTTADTIRKCPEMLLNKKPLLNAVKWHRIIMDEFHEIHTVAKYKYMLRLVDQFEATYKWCVTGTPFDKSDECLESMVNFVSDYGASNLSKVLEIDALQSHVMNSFFRKNTKKSVISENSLQPLSEEIIKLKFSPTERTLYNAYMVDPNIDKYSVLIRQLCCDPRIVDEIKTELSTCKTPGDIQKTMVSHYQKKTDDAAKAVRLIKYRIDKLDYRITVAHYRRQRRFLKTLGYKVQIEYPDKVVNPEFDKVIEQDDPDLALENLQADADSDDDSDDDGKVKKLIVVSAENQDKVKVLIKGLDTKTISKTIVDLNDSKNAWLAKLKTAEIEYDGKRRTAEFFKNMLEKINKIVNDAIEKNKDKENGNENADESDSNSDSDDDEDEEVCAICLGEITGDDVGVTKCGHMYCFQCIKTVTSNPAQASCPQCKTGLTKNDIYMISFERPKPTDSSKEIRDKMSLISRIGTKLANLIFYIRNTNEKCIVFSQWDALLKKVGDVLDTYGIKNVFCRGNVWTRDKAIREFTNNENIRVIMLSSDGAASGTNLTAATKVILLDPVYGTYEFRRNTEWQAIGRAYRTGQTKKVSVVRFVIKDTVEEEIYNQNIAEDAKFKVDVSKIMLSDDNLNLTAEEIEKIAKDAEVNSQKKKAKTKKVEKAEKAVAVEDDEN